MFSNMLDLIGKLARKNFTSFGFLQHKQTGMLRLGW